jgi:hypothetical protein
MARAAMIVQVSLSSAGHNGPRDEATGSLSLINYFASAYWQSIAADLRVRLIDLVAQGSSLAQLSNQRSSCAAPNRPVSHEGTSARVSDARFVFSSAA